MIVRILGEGQFDVSEDTLPELNALDAVLEQAVAAEDVEAFSAGLAALLDGVRRLGTPHAVDALDESDLVLPMADASLEEVRDLLADDGLIPG